MDIRYRFAEPGCDTDLELLTTMNRRLILDERADNPMTETELRERMRQWLQSHYSAAIFEGEGRPVGYALWRVQERGIYLRQFFIEAQHRRAGIGRLSLQWLADHAWTDAESLWLDVLCHNTTGLAFWSAMGFKEHCMTMKKPLTKRQGQV